MNNINIKQHIFVINSNTLVVPIHKIDTYILRGLKDTGAKYF
jgi:hypothetical protein